MMAVENEPNRLRIAFFIDSESLVEIANQLCLPVDLKPVFDRLFLHGQIILRRAFGDLDTACDPSRSVIGRDTVRTVLHRHSFPIEDTPTIGKRSNTDLRLVVEALSIAYSTKEIDGFAIFASDRDYFPLIEKLRALGKTTIGIGGSPRFTHPVYANTCDVFFYYEDLFTPEPSLTLTDSAEVEDSPFDILSLREQRAQRLDEYCRLLLEVTTLLERQNIRAVGGNIVPQMRLRRSDFDLSLVDMRTFRELASEAQQRGLVTVTPAGQDVLIASRAEGVPMPSPDTYAAELETTEKATLFYRKAIARKLRSDLLACAIRERAYMLTGQILRERQNVSTTDTEVKIPLDLLSQQVTEQLHDEEFIADQPSVFKLLYSLFRGGCFACELTNHAYRPLIFGLSPGAVDFDVVFIRNTLRVLRIDDPYMPLSAEPLAIVFEIEAATMQRIVSELNF